MKPNMLIAILTFSICLAARGDLLSTQILDTRNISNNQAYIENELSQIISDQFSLEPVQYGFWLYKITYETVDIHGNPHIASGSVSFPRVDWPQFPGEEAFPILSYQHGTVIEKSSVTSVNGEWILNAILTGSGYVYVEPDYLGLGDSEGRHPYQLAEPYGTAVVDMLRATRQLDAQRDDLKLNDQLFLAGYSEGGYATMAVQKIIERDYADEFSITISFPMAGAYSMSGIMTDVMLAYASYGQPFYFPYVLFSYIESYPVLGSHEEYLVPEYVFLYDMFDGYHSSGEINAAMPSIPITIMKPDSVQSFQENMNHPLRLALQENDLFDWHPEAPMHLFHGLGDELVPYENSQLAYDTFLANGADDIHLELIPADWGGHSEVAPFALFGAYELAKDIQMINPLGDVNQDMEFNILDLVRTAYIILHGHDNEYEVWAADVNKDDSINIQDIVLIVDLALSS
ncbi:MAG: lipase family protein [Candidatus Marinimicrobia bacterium]|nr:lipase family protein [Candidatus Neomarinimicrobiota bacterium]